jgi:thiol-disulfide isomerase/thioredoxin
MMKLLLSFLLLIVINEQTFTQDNVSASAEADWILEKTSQKLNSVTNIRYKHSRELNYSSENYHNLTTWDVYYDFQSADTIAGIKYLIESPTHKDVFNGTEKFELDKKAKALHVNDHPRPEVFSSLSALYNSIVTLKNIFPAVINDRNVIKTLTDTTINNKACYVLTFNIGKRRIKNLGKGFDAMQTSNDFIYKIMIDKATGLPFEVLQVNGINNDFIRTSFDDMQINSTPPPELSWYYSSYADEYKQANDKPDVQLLPVGSLAPNWELVSLTNGKTISLGDLAGKVILLDFWIKNCGPCIESVPHLNALKEEFKNEKFRIISINSYDTKEEVKWFSNKHKTAYEVFLNGKATAEQYGVTGFPTLFLIDETGKIIFSHEGFNGSARLDIEKSIKKAL